jgi:hypothetical protein
VLKALADDERNQHDLDNKPPSANEDDFQTPGLLGLALLMDLRAAGGCY